MSIKTKEQTAQQNTSDEMAAKAQAIRESIEKEVAGIDSVFAALLAAILATGLQGLHILAARVGDKVTASGRPSFASWHLFTTAIAYASERKHVTYGDIDSLLGTVRKHGKIALGDQHKLKDEALTKALARLVSSKTTANVGTASCKLKLGNPAAWDILL